MWYCTGVPATQGKQHWLTDRHLLHLAICNAAICRDELSLKYFISQNLHSSPVSKYLLVSSTLSKYSRGSAHYDCPKRAEFMNTFAGRNTSSILPECQHTA